MKNMFRGYYPPTKDELAKLWAEATIVLDANALLHLFRYSAGTRDELMALLKKEQKRIWIPHQVGAEFHRNRRGIAGQQQQAFKAVEIATEKANNGVKSAIEALGRHAMHEANDLLTVLRKHDSKLRKELKNARKRHADAVTSAEAQETTLQKITELYEGRVGDPYDSETLEKLFKEGAARYAKGQPPGFADAKNKEGDRKYGDLIVWLQILDHAGTKKKPMLFITDDSKDDWWDKTGDHANGPRAELVEEYFDASGERVHFYSVRRFLEYAKERGEKISAESVEEARTVSVTDALRRRRQTRALIEQANKVFTDSQQFAKLMESSKRVGDQSASQIRIPQDPRIVEWATQLDKVTIGGIAAKGLADQVRSTREFIASMEAPSETVRLLIEKEQEAQRRLRQLELLYDSDSSEDSDSGNSAPAEDDDS